MWTAVSEELGRLMGSDLYPCAYEDPSYGKYLEAAGLKKPFPRRHDLLSHAQRRNLVEAGRAHAGMLVSDLMAGNSLRERRAKAVLVRGPLNLYRLWTNSRRSGWGYWWFSQGLMDEARIAGGPAAQMAWLRERLAVSMDMSDCDRIAVLRLGVDDVVPGIEAWGLPMRMYTYKVAHGVWTNTAGSSSEYWANQSKWLQGGKTQTYLAWLPVRRMSDYY